MPVVLTPDEQMAFPRSVESFDAPPPPPPELAADPATRCREPHCQSTSTKQCSYVDNRGRPCRTRWCEDHSATVGSLRYCRRHAGTLSALGSKANNPRALPDVDHRGASLVRWVYRDLDPAIAALLERCGRPEENLLRDTEVAVSRDEAGARRWEMSWKLASAAGVTLRISLVVEEQDDAVLLVNLDGELVAHGTPPWIEARRRGYTMSEDEDRDRRRRFYAFLEEYLSQAVGRAR